MSIPLNIAEGVGKPSTAERQRYHSIARGSAMECGAIVNVVKLIGGAGMSDGQLSEAKELLVRIVSMLTKMCR